MKLFQREYLSPFLLADLIIENDTTGTVVLDFSQEMMSAKQSWKVFYAHSTNKPFFEPSLTLALYRPKVCTRLRFGETALALTFVDSLACESSRFCENSVSEVAMQSQYIYLIKLIVKVMIL